MQLIYVLFSIFIFFAIGCISNKGAVVPEFSGDNAGIQKRNISSMEDDLIDFSGSYDLEKGDPRKCPDGEFTARTNGITVGATLRIDRINQEKVVEEAGSSSSCQVEAEANFDGRKIVQIWNEKCGATTASRKIVIFSYRTKTTKYIRLLIQHKIGQSLQSEEQISCIYSVDL